jgi:hypothetical protein
MRWRRWAPELYLSLTLGVASAISVAIFARAGEVVWAFAVVWGMALIGSVFLPGVVARSGNDARRELHLFLAVGLVLGSVSIATGIGNNFTDEPHVMGGYLVELLRGQDPYTTFLTVTYRSHYLLFWSAEVTSASYYSYLPLLLFLQVPGTGAVGYELLALGCWGGVVYLVRNDPSAALVLASPVVALLASNGFTDLPVLLLLTYSLRGPPGPARKAVEYVSYGVKQFANAFWFVYYLLRREWPAAAAVVAITVLIALPFLLWHPTGIWCAALTFSLGPGCSSAPASFRQVSDLYSHWNYYLWPVWGYALFREPLRAAGRKLRAGFASSVAAP